MQRILFILLRLALDVPGGGNVDHALKALNALTAAEWELLHKVAAQQSILGLLFSGVQKLPKSMLPPKDLLFRWAYEANQIAQVNERMDKVASEVTRMFAERSLHPVILKGQANARLYPDPHCRQAGDVDVLIEGGRRGVARTMAQLGLPMRVDDAECDHHVEIDKKVFGGITVEVHFQAVACRTPLRGRSMLRYLDRELAREGGRTLTPEGFYVPNAAFALIMQLSHLREHFFEGGVGLRQLTDYYLLLQTSSADERARAAGALKNSGLEHMAGAVMYLMGVVYKLPTERMLCPPDRRRGLWLLSAALRGGNFGWYAMDRNVSAIKRKFAKRKRVLQLASFDAPYMFCHEYRYLKMFLSLMPLRIKRHRLVLNDV